MPYSPIEFDLSARRLLRSLGNSSDAIAETLRSQQITGLPNKTGYCPVANLLRQKTGYQWRVTCATASCPGVTQAAIHLPTAITDFVLSFDRGDYPDLVQNFVR